MRLEAGKPIKASKQILGGEKPLVCIPLVGKTREAIISEANNVPVIAPDIIELRIDAWNFIEDVPVYAGAVELAYVDFIDAELKYGGEKLGELLETLRGTKTSLIVSFHDFKATPPKEELFSIMEKEIQVGAHVAKLAAMPQREEDVLGVLEATLAIRRKYPDVPIISMSMGPLGAVTRLVGGVFGSDLTFAVGSKASAPGQIPVAELRKCFGVVYP